MDQLTERFPLCENARVTHPATFVVSGSTASGKTSLTLRLMKERETVFTPPIERAIFVCDCFQDQFKPYEGSIEFVKSLDDVELDGRSTILALDDMMSSKDSRITDFFTKGRHRNVTTLYLTQNLFAPNPHTRCLNTNAHHFLFLKSPRGCLQLGTLARQIFAGEKAKALQRIYEDHVTSRNYGYLWLNLAPDCPESLRVRSEFLASDRTDSDPFPIVFKI